MWELSVLPKNATQCPWPGLEPGLLDPESCSLTLRLPRLPLSSVLHCDKTLRTFRTPEKCRCVFYISLAFSNACRVLAQCDTWLRLLFLLNNAKVLLWVHNYDELMLADLCCCYGRFTLNPYVSEIKYQIKKFWIFHRIDIKTSCWTNLSKVRWSWVLFTYYVKKLLRCLFYQLDKNVPKNKNFA